VITCAGGSCIECRSCDLLGEGARLMSKGSIILALVRILLYAMFDSMITAIWSMRPNFIATFASFVHSISLTR
jgi:hypothetical protein